jgi:hypothetical protein
MKRAKELKFPCLVTALKEVIGFYFNIGFWRVKVARRF